MKKEKETKKYDCYFYATPTAEGITNDYSDGENISEAFIKYNSVYAPIKYKKNNYINVNLDMNDVEYYKFVISVIKKNLTNKKILTYSALINQVKMVKDIYETKRTYNIDDFYDSLMHILIDIPNMLLYKFYSDVWDITNKVIKAINKKYKNYFSTQFTINHMILCAYSYEVKEESSKSSIDANKITYVKIETGSEVRVMLLSEILFYLFYKKHDGRTDVYDVYKKYMKAYLKNEFYESENLFSKKTTSEIISDMRMQVRNHHIKSKKEFEMDKYALEGKMYGETY